LAFGIDEYKPPFDKTIHLLLHGYSEKFWISSGAKLKEKERLTLGATNPVLPYAIWDPVA
jgi:hypothetical protein